MPFVDLSRWPKDVLDQAPRDLHVACLQTLLQVVRIAQLVGVGVAEQFEGCEGRVNEASLALDVYLISENAAFTAYFFEFALDDCRFNIAALGCLTTWSSAPILLSALHMTAC